MLDQDGSARDINFQAPTWEGVDRFFRRVEGCFRDICVSDGNGTDLPNPNWQRMKQAVTQTGVVRGLFKGSQTLPRNMQAFVFKQGDGSPFLELTFFPEDFANTDDLARSFLTWIEEAKTCLQAERYFCRYENASWTFGDTGRYSGVFLVSDNADEILQRIT
ncbi:hypothetical protein RXV86_08980 [Alisedimentitalea sp. MJ-SS2]|uniref:hypothetical protein n=1 Tax=Aliisedimentitalea sp. MJ-SS2 TaxID=3049795 RepID=UPI0029143289|nr:hypothetical protein [Alisedimentitalea sp. MJ-SS2]MDU8927515.1 hypothetical protein [Alisedimentitalea sp. MJ-SS2]